MRVLSKVSSKAAFGEQAEQPSALRGGEVVKQKSCRDRHKALLMIFKEENAREKEILMMKSQGCVGLSVGG